jgi:signal recognition particle GTPase
MELAMEIDFNDVRSQIAEMVARGDASAEMAADSQRLLEVIDAMTPEERSDYDLLLDTPRRQRLADQVGVPREDVDELVRQRYGLAQMMKKIEGMQ